jgi:hypothetical protein
MTADKVVNEKKAGSIIDKSITVEKLVDFIQSLTKKQFYGKITIQFEGGNVIRIIKETSIKQL